MEYINPPAESPKGMSHHTFFSTLYRHEIGYNLYLTPDYEEGLDRYPVHFHFHGWTGNESSEICALADLCTSRRAITVFPNSSPVIEERDNLPVEQMIIGELMPLIDRLYRTEATREHRSVSGFSMGGGMAIYCAVKHPSLFGSATAYAGTFHHYYHRGYLGVGEPVSQAAGYYGEMIREGRQFEEGNILNYISINAEALRGIKLIISVGDRDPLYCDSEILHLHLKDLSIPHEYTVLPGVGHDIAKYASAGI